VPKKKMQCSAGELHRLQTQLAKARRGLTSTLYRCQLFIAATIDHIRKQYEQTFSSLSSDITFGSSKPKESPRTSWYGVCCY